MFLYRFFFLFIHLLSENITKPVQATTKIMNERKRVERSKTLDYYIIIILFTSNNYNHIKNKKPNIFTNTQQMSNRN